jgi:hypothetical protein
MARSEKQADLRRRMAEARVKLASAVPSSSYDDDNDQEESLSSFAIGATSYTHSSLDPPSLQSHTHHPPRGGILKKSKYTSSFTGVAAELSKNNATPPPKLSVLLAGYDNSSSSSSDEDENGNGSNRVRIASQSSPPTATVASPPTATSIATPTEMENNVSKTVMNNNNNNDETEVADPSSSSSSSSAAAAASMISDSVWDEFEALLEQDEEEMMMSSTSSSRVNANNQMMEENDTTTTSGGATVSDNSDVVKSTETKLKKTKKRKRRKEENNGELTNDDQEDIEQVSYEARLARLMLLRSEKRLRGSSGKNDGKDLLLSSSSSSSLQLSSSAMNEFYDSGLAFQEEGLDDDEEMEMGQTDNVVDKNPRRQDSHDVQTTTIAVAPAGNGAMLASTHPPSLVDILREKRNEARKLSSRGVAADDSQIHDKNTTDDIDCVSDGRWF